MSRRERAAKVVRLDAERRSRDRRAAAALAPSSPAVLADGATVEIDREAVTVKDRDGRLLVRYADGHAEIAAPAGDLRLSAPNGRVAIAAATDVTIEAQRDLVERAQRRVDVAAGPADRTPALRVERQSVAVRSKRVAVETEQAHVVAGEASVVARAVITTAERIAHHAERYEVEATRLFERTRDSFRDVADLCQSHVGRARTVVRDVYALWSRRTTMASQDDTSIDGKRVLLG
jgi:hypothetical protein